MKKDLSGVKVAVLAANGFSQDDMVAAQKALIAVGANVRIVSPENGLVNGWHDNTWGHHFAVDTPLGSALGADFEILIIPGGQRSVEKLNLTAHTRRFIVSFLESEKPVIVMDNALNILVLTGQIEGRTVSGPADMKDMAVQAAAIWGAQDFCIDGCLMTGAITSETRADFVREMMTHISADRNVLRAA